MGKIKEAIELFKLNAETFPESWNVGILKGCFEVNAHGILAIMADKLLARKVSVDVGRIHYHRWVYVGSTGTDVAAAYQPPVRSNLKGGGRTWFVGAGGPMGRMHVQRAIGFNNPPSVIVCSDVSDMRLSELCDSFSDQARAKGIEFVACFAFETARIGGIPVKLDDFGIRHS
jgi:hypothetical protein